MGLVSWIKEKLDKLDANDRSYYLVTLLTVIILLPVLLIMQISSWFCLLYFLTPFVLYHKDLKEYFGCIKNDIAIMIGLTLLILLTIFMSNNEGFKAFIAAIYIIGNTVIGGHSLKKLVQYMKSIGVE